jgi:hypothetical protein
MAGRGLESVGEGRAPPVLNFNQLTVGIVPYRLNEIAVNLTRAAIGLAGFRSCLFVVQTAR